jgi:hypothetical protein
VHNKTFARRLLRVITLMVIASGCAVGGAGCATGSGTPRAAVTAPVAPPSTSTSAAASTSVPSASSDAAAYPIACSALTDTADLGTPAPSEVSLAQISTAVGFPVSDSVLDGNSMFGFRGYEDCQYNFNTPSGDADLEVLVVVGTDPNTTSNESAAQDLADTVAQKLPRSLRDVNCLGDDNCTWAVAATPGIGDKAYTLTRADGTIVVAALRGDVYIEVGPGGLKLFRQLAVARLIFDNVH